jgi:thiosulfate/3-mercaptopyruvate sulfurtransferase
LQGEFSGFQHRASLHDAGCCASRGAFGRHGVSNDSRVVLYSIGTPMWATRFWWMLTSLGFENVAVLDGGLDKWKLEGRALETGPAKGYQPATFTANRKADFSSTSTQRSRPPPSGHGRRQRARPAIP